MPGIDYREARARLRLAAVLELLGFEPCARLGEHVRGPCPVHRSRTPTSRSFAAHLGKNLWHCFSCSAGGNALDLWAAVTRQPLHTAVLDLCNRLGQVVPLLTRPARRTGPREESTMPEP